MRRLISLLTLVSVAVGLAPSAFGAVTAADLRAGDVVFDTGVTRPETDRQRLERTARDLGAQGFRTKFVVVPNRIDDIEGLADQLRREVGDAAVEAVLVLGPRQLGIDAKVFDCEKRLAFAAEVATLRTDDVQGTINVANRLQEFNKAQVLRDADCNDLDGPAPTTGGGFSTGLIVLIVTVGLIGLAAVVLARRAAKRAQRRRADEERAAFSPVLDVLAAQISDLGDEVDTGPNAVEAKRRYDVAVTAYGEVRDRLATMDGWDADTMRTTLRDAIHSALAARALVDGKPAPDDDPPILQGLCAFDPKHGRAVTTREIVTPSGNRAVVPVCATCDAGLQRDEMPHPRMVVVSGRDVPYWQIQGLGGMFGPPMGQMLTGLLEELITGNEPKPGGHPQ